MIEQNYNTLCVDSFFSNPDLILKFVNTLKFYKSDDGSWPGERTEPLYKINKELSDLIVSKILNNVYDLSQSKVNWEGSQLSFQKVNPYSNKKESYKNKGWIHQDGDDYDLAGLIYLTKDVDLNSGTSLFKKKDDKKLIKDLDNYEHQNLKNKLYSDMPVSENKYKKQMKKHNSNFDETVTFKNVFNRMIMYHGQTYHKANTFSDKERLTLVFFLKGISTENYQSLIFNRKKAVNSQIENIMKSSI